MPLKDGTPTARELGAKNASPQETIEQYKLRSKAACDKLHAAKKKLTPEQAREKYRVSVAKKKATLSAKDKRIEELEKRLKLLESLPDVKEAAKEVDQVLGEVKVAKDKQASYLKKVAKRQAGTRFCLATDIVWVYKNLGVDEAELTVAPSLGALQLLKWVKKNEKHQHTFYSTMVPKALAVKAGKAKAEKAKEDEGKVVDMGLGEVEILLEQFSDTYKRGSTRE
jgi:hypothetical protein